MPVLIVYGVLKTTYNSSLEGVRMDLRRTVSESLGDITREDVSFFFPGDLCYTCPSKEIVIFVQGLHRKPGRTDNVLRKLAASIADVVHRWFPLARIECYVTTQEPSHTCVIEASQQVNVA
jgi:hypothetical protein